MTVFAQLAVSLDGYVAGPNDGRGNPLGDRGETVHAWVYSLATRRERQGLTGGRTGATVMGRRTFDNGEEPWGREPPFRTPVFVVTNRAREPLRREGGTTFTFVTEGLESAVERARAAAGARDVRVAGGADVLQQTLAAGLLDELELRLAPVFLGGGGAALRPSRARRRAPRADAGRRLARRRPPPLPPQPRSRRRGRSALRREPPRRAGAGETRPPDGRGFGQPTRTWPRISPAPLRGVCTLT